MPDLERLVAPLDVKLHVGRGLHLARVRLAGLPYAGGPRQQDERETYGEEPEEAPRGSGFRGEVFDEVHGL